MHTTTTDHCTAMLNTHQAAAALGLRPQTLAEWRTRGIGPRYRKYGRAVRYSMTDIVAYADAQVVETSTSTGGGQ